MNTGKIDTQTLLNFQKGDHGAFQKIFDCYYHAIYHFLRKLTASNEEAEDITLRTFQKLFERCSSFDLEVNIKAFLFISARNSGLDYLRYVKYQNERQREFANRMQNEKLLQYEYEINDELLNTVISAIESLPEECKRIFKMLYFQDLKPAEIAEILKISVNTVYVQKSRALQALRLRLSDNSMAIMWIVCAIPHLKSTILA